MFQEAMMTFLSSLTSLEKKLNLLKIKELLSLMAETRKRPTEVKRILIVIHRRSELVSRPKIKKRQ